VPRLPLNFAMKMKSLTGFLKVLVVVVVLLAVGGLVISNYAWVFSKRVTGKVVDVERVTDPTAIISSRVTEAQMYSYSVLIQGDDGHLYTASSEDRKWQVVKKGYCVEALLFRYPPWMLERANTFYNAQVKDVKVCPGETTLPETPAEKPTERPAPPGVAAPRPSPSAPAGPPPQ
jgi:hypothetical protein